MKTPGIGPSRCRALLLEQLRQEQLRLHKIFDAVFLFCKDGMSD